jgi:hypothetical protein
MKLSEAFDQVDVTLEQAQAILTNMVRDVRDASPELYQAVMDASANLQAPQNGARKEEKEESKAESKPALKAKE